MFARLWNEREAMCHTDVFHTDDNIVKEDTDLLSEGWLGYQGQNYSPQKSYVPWGIKYFKRVHGPCSPVCLTSWMNNRWVYAHRVKFTQTHGNKVHERAVDPTAIQMHIWAHWCKPKTCWYFWNTFKNDKISMFSWQDVYGCYILWRDVATLAQYITRSIVVIFYFMKSDAHQGKINRAQRQPTGYQIRPKRFKYTI